MTKSTDSPRQQLMDFLDGKPLDRPPVWLLFPYHPLGCYVDVRTHPMYRRVHEASKGVAVILNRRHIGVPAFADEVTDFSEAYEQDGWTIDRRVIRWQHIELTHETCRRGDEVRVKKLLETDEDLELFAQLPQNTDPSVIAHQMEGHLDMYRRERDEFPPELGAMMLGLGEPIAMLYGSSNLEQFSIWSITHAELVQQVLDDTMKRCRAVYQWCLQRELAEVYFMVGSELAAPPLVSRATFDRWIVPYAKELIEMVHEAGQRVIQHFHGQVAEVLPGFVKMGADALHTIEEPPVGNCTLEQAYEAVGDRIGLIGNIQYDDFRAWPPERMREEVRRLIQRTHERRFMLSPTAGPFDPDPPQRLIDNYLAMLEEVQAQ